MDSSSESVKFYYVGPDLGKSLAEWNLVKTAKAAPAEVSKLKEVSQVTGPPALVMVKNNLAMASKEFHFILPDGNQAVVVVTDLEAMQSGFTPEKLAGLKLEDMMKSGLGAKPTPEAEPEEKKVSIDEFLERGLTETGAAGGYTCPGCGESCAEKVGPEITMRTVYWKLRESSSFVVWHRYCWRIRNSPQFQAEMAKTELDEEVLPEVPKLAKPKPKAPAKVVGRRALNWLKFLGIPASALPLDLMRQAADFYLLEFSATVLGHEPERYKAYSEWLAELYAKYMLAACLGEFRHRPPSVPDAPLVAVPRSTNRALAHDRAMLIWSMGSKAVSKAFELLDKGFSHPTWTGSNGGGVGGTNWATIARVGGLYIKGLIPPGVFIDTAYNIVHNGGRLFDKGRAGENKSLGACNLFESESELRALLIRKVQRGLEVLVEYSSPEVREGHANARLAWERRRSDRPDEHEHRKQPKSAKGG